MAKEETDPVAWASRQATRRPAGKIGMQKTRIARTKDVPRDADDLTFADARPQNLDDANNRQNAEAEELGGVEPDLDPYGQTRKKKRNNRDL